MSNDTITIELTPEEISALAKAATFYIDSAMAFGARAMLGSFPTAYHLNAVMIKIAPLVVQRTEQEENQTDPRLQRVYESICRNDPAHVQEIAQDCGCSIEKAYAIAQILVEQDKVYRVSDTMFKPNREAH